VVVSSGDIVAYRSFGGGGDYLDPVAMWRGPVAPRSTASDRRVRPEGRGERGGHQQ
jgi:hypothetical protein